MRLTCPECGSNRIIYAGTTTRDYGGYGATDAKYTCKDCGYTGPLVIDTEKEEAATFQSKDKGEKLKLPLFWVFLLGLISLLAISWGAKVEIAFLFFAIFSLILGVFFYFVREDEFEPVEKDLEQLDKEGKLRSKRSLNP